MHPVAGLGRQVQGLRQPGDRGPGVRRVVLQGTQFGQQALPAGVGQRFVERPAQIGDGVVGAGVDGHRHRVPQDA